MLGGGGGGGDNAMYLYLWDTHYKIRNWQTIIDGNCYPPSASASE